MNRILKVIYNNYKQYKWLNNFNGKNFNKSYQKWITKARKCPKDYSNPIISVIHKQKRRKEKSESRKISVIIQIKKKYYKTLINKIQLSNNK